MAKGAKASPAINPAPLQIKMTLATIGITLWKIHLRLNGSEMETAPHTDYINSID
jgi:hypothetical protein